MWKILYKNILALHRYRDFRVRIFYFAICLTMYTKCYCFLKRKYGVINNVRAKNVGLTFYGPPSTCNVQTVETSSHVSHVTLVKEALIEIGCVVTSLVVGWLSRACTVAKRCILGL